MSERYDLLIRGGTLVPMAAPREWRRGDLAVRDGRIACLGPDVAADATAECVLDASEALVLPGFVQAHVHVVQSLLRHQADNLELLDWLRQRTWPYEAALDGDGVEAAAELGIMELVCGGTTTVLDFGTTHDHHRVFQVAERLGIRMTSGKTHMDSGEGVPAGLLEQTERSLADAEALGRRWHGAAGGRLGYAVAPRFVLSCTAAMLDGCVELARRHGWLLHTHASENRGEVAAVRRATGRDNVVYLHEVGLTGNDVVLAHGVHLADHEMEILARTGTTICHCPGANLKLASGIADLPRLLERSVPVALGADGPPCNNRLSIFHEMSLAGTLHGLRHGPTAVDAWTVLHMATLGGARALGLGERTGSLEPGKAADVVVIGLEEWSLLPDGDPASRIVYGGGTSAVRHVVVDGRPVVMDHEPVAVDRQALRGRIAAAWQATAARMEELT